MSNIIASLSQHDPTPIPSVNPQDWRQEKVVCLFFAKHVNILLCFSGLMI